MPGRPLAAPPPLRHLPATMTERIVITVNGEERDIAAGQTVAALLAAIGLDTRKVAVERNAEIVPRSTYAAVALQPGDRLEIVHFIGGG